MLLEVRQLEVCRGGIPVFPPVDFVLNAGESIRVVGPNGSGKTSLLRLLSGLSRPDGGTILWQQKSVFKSLLDFYKNIVFLGHDLGLKQQLTAWENLQLSLSLWGAVASKSSVSAVLERLDLGGLINRPVMKMSAGQKRRVSLARLELLSHRQLWILDEPFTSLDSGTVEYLIKLLRKHTESGGLLIFTTHQNVDSISSVKTLELGVTC